ncbi:MAG: DUF2442 domain-containing protein [Alphaproteobacteria bacterium]|nr:DUF2442 domain-containing protein [Alphaproteobacteria bacterium]MDE2111588.1 DUF2442 domain-containing protein [Alphaproteobacteria bacterium]MDE2495740.1 DUF2442 domain-containing protein [Alphaproteobacteria bacterium]
MSISAVAVDPRVSNVEVTEQTLVVTLRDGRQISAPLSWFPRLAQADAKAKSRWELAAAGHGIHWPLIDEDLSVDGLLQGSAAPRLRP